MAKNFYAVKKGRIPGIYITWEDCKAQVDGFSGAIYKKFSTYIEAQEFLGNISKSKKVISDSKNEQEIKAVAYVDGSYNDITKEFSYGVVLFYDGMKECFSEKYTKSPLAIMRNVAGEIKGAERAMQFCIDNKINKIDIYYDYEGIKKWCTGEWKAKQTGTKEYKAFYDKIKNHLNVHFIKVKSHSGNKYNDLADELAKGELGIDVCPDVIEGKNDMIANNVSFKDIVSIIELLKEDIPDLEVEQYEVPYGEGFSLSIKRPSKQKLKIVHFTGKNKLHLQGKKEDLFNQLSLYIIELLEVNEVPKFLNTVHQMDIDTDLVESEFNIYFPNAKGKLPPKVNNYLHQAVYNLRISGNMYNATFLVEPVIRPLEAVLKIALIDNNIPIRKEDRNYDSFFVFKKEQNKEVWKLNPIYILPEHSKEFLKYLMIIYNHFHKHRHTLSHWDNPRESNDTTRVIMTSGEAHTLIKDTIKIIDEYYKL